MLKAKIILNYLKFSSLLFSIFMATYKTWTRTLDLDRGPRPWTWTLDPDPGSDSDLGPRPWTWTLKNLDPEKHGKQLGMEKLLEDHIL